MKKLLLLLIFVLASSCEGTSGGGGGCSYNGHILHVGPEGGCYYINSSGNKEYVDRSNCASCN